MKNNGHNHNSSSNNLKIAFLLNVTFTILEFFGGYFVNSVAIVSDALHDLGDSFALGIAWYLEIISKKKSSHRFSFGYRRFSLLGALISSVILITGSIFVIYEGLGRILDPEPSNAKGMLILALIGVLVNGYAAWKVSHGSSLNERMISWHLIEDVLGWVAVLIVAIVLNIKQIDYLDPALSILITIYILFNVFKRLKETIFIFLQGIPTNLDPKEVERVILKIPNVIDTHHTNIWSLEGENHVYTGHVLIDNVSEYSEIISIKKQIKDALKQFNFEYYTIELEFEREEDCLN